MTDHPQVVLLFALEGQPDDDASDRMRAVVAELVRARAWSVSVPQLVDEVDEDSAIDPDDEPIRTVGLFVKVYSGYPPFGDRIPIAVDRAQYEDVKMLVERMSRFSMEIQDDIVVEYDGEAIGWIESGVPDTGLSETFLEEWRRSIAARGGA